MSIEYRTIKFSIKGAMISAEVSKYASKRKKGECTLDIQNDVVKGCFYSSEYDEVFDNWEPSLPVPRYNELKWILDVMSHGSLITKAGVKAMTKKIAELDESLEAYEIMHHQCSPQGLNFVHYQKYDGNQVCTYAMNTDKWEHMWDINKRKKAETIFSKHGFSMDDFMIYSSFIGDTFDYLKEKPVFMELMEEFADKTVTKKICGDEESILEAQISELLSEIDKWAVSPDSIDYESANIDASLYAINILSPYESWEDRMRLQFFVESCISQLGATKRSSTGTTTDVTVLIRNYKDYANNYGICKYYNIQSLETVTFVWNGPTIKKKNISEKEYRIGQLVVYKEYLEGFLENFNESNTKRTTRKKPKSPIKIVYEDQWFDYLIKLDKDVTFHEGRQSVTRNMIENSPYVGGNVDKIAGIYNAKPQGRDFDL